jgi:2-polyprenyl-3-methyl-5-hydroxy-6-metoxy-1,4-benzoquinol methylase
VCLTGDAMGRPEDYPELMKIIHLISAENPLQRKRINAFVSRQDVGYWTFAEEMSRTLNSSLLQNDQVRVEAAQSYNRMCMDILREQIRFRKTGVYLLDDAHVAHETVYSQKSVMRYYIVGLLLSYLFWPNHFQMLCFFKDHLLKIQVERCLEVGVGHGLFTVEMMRRFPNSEVTLVDISQTSLELAQEMLTTFHLDSSRVRFVHGDYLKVSLGSGDFDFIIMGEVLEHVNDASGFLTRARQLLRPGGTIFLSTCANCPAVDHIYHFHNVDEIRALIRSVGLSIVRDSALPAEDVPEARWEQDLVTINYSAILSRG